jgi:hypothetical protein
MRSAQIQQNGDKSLMETSVDQSHGHGDLIQEYYGLEIQSNSGRYDESKTY